MRATGRWSGRGWRSPAPGRRHRSIRGCGSRRSAPRRFHRARRTDPAARLRHPRSTGACRGGRDCSRSPHWRRSGCWRWSGSSAPAGWSARRGNRAGNAARVRPARRASRRWTGHHRRLPAHCRYRRPAPARRRTGWRWYPGIRRSGSARNAADSAPAAPGSSAAARACAAAVRRNPPARRAGRLLRRRHRCAAADRSRRGRPGSRRRVCLRPCAH